MNLLDSLWNDYLNRPGQLTVPGQPRNRNADLTYPFKEFDISYHDHWLNEEESASRPMVYLQFVELGQRESYMKFENKVLDFLIDLFRKTTFFVECHPDALKGILETEPYFEESRVLKLDEWVDYTEHCPLVPIKQEKDLVILARDALRNENLSTFFLPEYRVAIATSYDLTWPIFLFEPYFNEIEELARNAGLFILEVNIKSK